MKKHKTLGIVIMALLFSIPVITNAAPSINAPFGGRVLLGAKEMSALITCTAQYGPFTIQPFNIAPPAPYFIGTSSKAGPTNGGYILGLYNPIPNMNTCFNPETGAPIPSFSVKLYGVSR